MFYIFESRKEGLKMKIASYNLANYNQQKTNFGIRARVPHPVNIKQQPETLQSKTPGKVMKVADAVAGALLNTFATVLVGVGFILTFFK